MNKVVVKVVKTAIIIFWLTMLSLLIIRNTSFLSPSAIAEGILKTEDSEEWMGIYMNGKKVGYTNTTYRKEGNRQRIIEKSFLKLNVMNQYREVKTLVDSLFDQDGTINQFNFRIDSGDINLEVRGKKQDVGIALVINTGGITREEFVKVPGKIYLPQGIKLFMKDKRFKPGDKYMIKLMDPSIFKASEMEIEVVGIDNMTIEGKSIRVYKLREMFMGFESVAYVTDEGDVVREEGPLGTVALRETREEAINKGWAKDEELDFILSTAIPVFRELPHPENLSYLKVRISGIDTDIINLNSDRQKFTGNILEIRKELEPDNNVKASYTIPFSGEGMKEYLQPNPLIQSDNNEIKELAGKITKNTNDPVLAANLIANWIYKNLEKTPTISIPSALEVLKTKRGDCNEHAVLFAALARAAGIPSKVVVGLMYQNGYFFYHAWNEIFVGKWLSIDSTFNQFPADVTHIKLAEGDVWEWLKIINVVGKLKIEILDAIEEY